MQFDARIRRTSGEEIDNPERAIAVVGGNQGQAGFGSQQLGGSVDEFVGRQFQDSAPWSLDQEMFRARLTRGHVATTWAAARNRPASGHANTPRMAQPMSAPMRGAVTMAGVLCTCSRSE